MRAAILLIAISAVEAGVVSRDWINGTLTLQLDDGVAEIEWISGTSFRYSTGEKSLPVLPKIKHDRVVPELEDTKTGLTLRGRYLTIEIDKATAALRIRANGQIVSTLAIDGLELHISPLGKTFGLAGPGDSQRFFFTTGYGIFFRAPREPAFDLERGTVRMASRSMEFFFYYGPTPKEIFEQHQLVAGKGEIQSLYVPSAKNWPEGASPLSDTVLDSWEPLERLLRTLNQWSLSGVLYPALDLATLRFGRGEVGKRAADLAVMLPLLAGDTRNIRLATREMWTPYLITYLHEAYERGYPLIRPLPVEFSRDKDLDPQSGVFMLGDEVLLAPMVAAGERRSLKLPPGIWTDLRTGAKYRGKQEIEVEAPAGQVPTFARNGAVLPLQTKRAMELHYFPSLGGEFFLWEPDKRENSQFHAAPAGDFTRVEIESQLARTYEWVIHHAGRPATVTEGATAYTPVRQYSKLAAGMWWHDELRNDLHVMLHCEAGCDRIVNISF